MLTAGNFIVESATASSDEDESSPLIKDMLCGALRRRDLGAVGEHCSMANTDLGEGGEALPSQRDKAVCNSTSTTGNNVGNTQGEHPLCSAEHKGADSFMLTDFAKMIRLLSPLIRIRLRLWSLISGLVVLAREVER